MSTSAPYARGNEASRQAADAVEHKLDGVRAKVFDFIRSRGAYGATGSEIAAATEIALLTVRPRCTDLGQAGYIYDSGMLRKNDDRKNETVWAACDNFPTGEWRPRHPATAPAQPALPLLLSPGTAVERGRYEFTEKEMRVVGGFHLLPHRTRLEEMAKFFANRDIFEIMRMFSNYIDMAETVILNTREQYEVFAIAGGNLHPNDADKVNVPSILGAINGLKIAGDLDPAKFCHGCAFRKSSVANTCLTTVADTEYCSQEGQTFMCHENLDPKTGEPTQKCRGFLKAEKEKS
jgi:hypothetical protein